MRLSQRAVDPDTWNTTTTPRTSLLTAHHNRTFPIVNVPSNRFAINVGTFSLPSIRPIPRFTSFSFSFLLALDCVHVCMCVLCVRERVARAAASTTENRTHVDWWGLIPNAIPHNNKLIESIKKTPSQASSHGVQPYRRTIYTRFIFLRCKKTYYHLPLRSHRLIM